MSAPFQMWSLLLYCTQQLGMVIGMGGALFLLVAYLFDIRDSKIDDHEMGIVYGAKRVIIAGICLIIVSGVGIIYIHWASSRGDILLAPAFIFKWILIAVVLGISLFHRKISVSSGIIEGMAGGSWLALLLLHILAPVTSFALLSITFVVWMLGFMTFWSLGVFLIFGRSAFFKDLSTQNFFEEASVQKQIASAVIVPPPTPLLKAPALKPPIVLQVEAVTSATAKTQVQKSTEPIFIPLTSLYNEPFPYKKIVVDSTEILHPHLTEDPTLVPVATAMPSVPGGQSAYLVAADVTEHLPAVRIMPQTPADLETQHRGPIVKFG